MKKKLILILFIGFLLFIQPLSAQTWKATKRLTKTSGTSWGPTVATDSNGHIHVVWYDDTPGSWQLYFKRSTDGGNTWTTKRLTWTGMAYYPAMAIDLSNNIHLTWCAGNEIYYKRSTDGGTNWTTKRITWNIGVSQRPSIAVDFNNHIYVVWQDLTPGNNEIYYKRSTDGGVSWIGKRLSWGSGNSEHPAIAVDSNNHLYTVWSDNSLGSNYEINYKRSTNGGVIWTHKRLTFSSGDSKYPAIAVDNTNNIHVTWQENPSWYYIYHKRSTDGGHTWTTKRLTWSYIASNPATAIDLNNNIHLTYNDSSPGNNEIYYKRSTNGGDTWTTKRLTYNSGWSSSPAITTASINNIHVFWYDDTPGNSEIYYKKGIQ